MFQKIDYPLNRRLHIQVKKMLFEEILRGEYAQSDMLPPEAELCIRFGTSRGTLRHAVTSLEQEGYVKRRQGIGTIIDRNVCSMQTRIDIKFEFSELIANSHYKPSVKFLDVRETAAGEENAQILQISPDEPIYHISKLWLADDKPAIFCTDRIPVRLFREPFTPDFFSQDIFTILRNLCHEEVDHQIGHIVPCCLSEELSKILLIPANVPVVSINGASYNFDGAPVLCDTEYYSTGIFDFSMLRARI